MTKSLFLLKGEAHRLLAKVFPPAKNPPRNIRRQEWLSVAGPIRNGKVQIHISKMTVEEIKVLLERLEKMVK